MKYKAINKTKTTKVKISSGEIVSIETEKVFFRPVSFAESDADLNDCFQFEIAQYPPLLFEKERSMRITKKFDLWKYFDDECPISHDR